MVAEKPSIAIAITRILSKGSVCVPSSASYISSLLSTHRFYVPSLHILL